MQDECFCESVSFTSRTVNQYPLYTERVLRIISSFPILDDTLQCLAFYCRFVSPFGSKEAFQQHATLEGFARYKLFLSPPLSMGGCLLSLGVGESAKRESGEICGSPIMLGNGLFQAFVCSVLFSIWGKSGGDSLQNLYITFGLSV